MLDRRRSIMVTVAVGVVVTACASVPVSAPQVSTLPGAAPVAAPASHPLTWSTAPPDVAGALRAITSGLAKLYPTTTATSTTQPPTPNIVPIAPNIGTSPAPISNRRCPALAALFNTIFGPASPWAQSIAWRESNCQPAARNASGSSGLMQLLGHDDLLAAACPTVPPSTSWAIPECNLRAAKFLFDASGVRPWAL